MVDGETDKPKSTTQKPEPVLATADAKLLELQKKYEKSQQQVIRLKAEVATLYDQLQDSRIQLRDLRAALNRQYRYYRENGIASHQDARKGEKRSIWKQLLRK